MPSTSKKQHNFMAAIAHSPSFAKKVGVSQSVGKDFNSADKGKTFAKGGVTQQKINKQNTRHGMMDLPVANLSRFAGIKKGGAVMKEPKDAMMPRRPRGMTPPVAPQSPMGMGMKKGGMPMKDGKPAFMKKFAAGGNMNPKGSMTGFSRAGENTKIQKRGLTEGRVIKMASGGSVSSASRRADGIAQRGKTRC